MKRIIAVNSNCYHGYSIEDAVAGIKAAGFRYIELTATKGWTEHVFPDQSFARLLEVKKLLDDNGLIPFSMSGHTNLMDAERIPDFINNICLARFFGCRYIVSSIGEAHMEDRAVASSEQIAEHIRGFLPWLEKYGMTLVLETHGDHGTGKILSGIVTLINSPRVMINYDTANAVFWGLLSPEELVEDFRNTIPSIGYLHIKDKLGAAKDWNFPAPGQGYIPFPTLFDMMDAQENMSPYSIEIEFTEKGPKDLAEIDRAVAGSAEYLKSLGFEL